MQGRHHETHTTRAHTFLCPTLDRFGKFIELQFDTSLLSLNRFALPSARDSPLVGASVRTFLLEKVRVVRQAEGERNFHVFYLLGKGGTREQLEEWRLEKVDPAASKLGGAGGAGGAGGEASWRASAYLRQSGCFERRDGVKDEHLFQQLNQASERAKGPRLLAKQNQIHKITPTRLFNLF